MKHLLCILGCIASLAISSAVQAQDEIVVTGTRLDRYSRDEVPVIYLTKKADFVLANTTVYSDRRDSTDRRKEITKTLENLVAAAKRNNSIELSVLEEFEDDYDTLYFARPFTADMIKDVIKYGGLQNTSKASIVVKTSVKDTDDFETALTRIEDFAEDVQTVGRTTISTSDDPSLSIVGLQNYRAPLLEKISQDINGIKQTFPEAEIHISGLDKQLRWERASPLELRIYFPYMLSIEN
jgi:hypothetical protein